MFLDRLKLIGVIVLVLCAYMFLVPVSIHRQYGKLLLVPIVWTVVLIYLDPKHFFRRSRTAAVNWVGLLICIVVCVLAAIPALGMYHPLVTRRGKPIDLSFFTGSLGFFAAKIGFWFVRRVIVRCDLSYRWLAPDDARDYVRDLRLKI